MKGENGRRSIENKPSSGERSKEKLLLRKLKKRDNEERNFRSHAHKQK